MNGQTLSLRRRVYNRGMRALMWLCAGLTCALLVFLIGYIFCRGIPGLTWELLSGQTSYIKNTIGILPNIFNTLYIILVAMVIVLPLGVGAAIYLTSFGYPVLLAASRKSTLGAVLGGVPAEQRLEGTIATSLQAIYAGAQMVRVHDVEENVRAIRTLEAILRGSAE